MGTQTQRPGVRRVSPLAPILHEITRIAITPGEPAGIGPDIVLELAAEPWPAELVVIADLNLLADRAHSLGLTIDLQAFDGRAAPEPSRPGRLIVCAEPMAARVSAGHADPANATYVLETLERACAGCAHGEFTAMVTGPVNKSVIADAGIKFSGHTEYLAAQTNTPQPVMLLVAGDLRVALVTTHLALRDVPASIDEPRIRRILRVLDTGLKTHFGIEAPRIIVLGLNPHAGESGHLGSEEREIIEPALEALRSDGMRLVGPLPADTAFTPAVLSGADAILAMYHDQGLPVLKNRGFGHAVNVTLGLPIIRTSVGHGTALGLAGTGRADAGSMRAAVRLAIDMQAH